MRNIINKLTEIWKDINYPFLISNGTELRFSDVLNQSEFSFSEIQKGDVVAIIGDFNAKTIFLFLKLIDIKAIIVPLTFETVKDHEYYFDCALVDYVVVDNTVIRREHIKNHEYIDKLRELEHSGLILFSSGTTGRPKAILHDFSLFLSRYETPRPALRTLAFLLFDHIGGINTLLHTLFNNGIVIAPKSRTVDSILETCLKYNVEVLPTTPTFLRMILMSGAAPSRIPKSLKVITYGTERMDQGTLNELCRLLPWIDFRQTFGMSELGILRVKSESRDSLFMKVGGEGVKTKIEDDVLLINSNSRMVGYLNAPSPFDDDGWYNTNDIVETKGDYFKVTGRVSDVINVGGLKFMASEVERVALAFPTVSFAKVISKPNPITGQHVELIVQSSLNDSTNKHLLMKYLKENLQSHMVPRRIVVENIEINHRFKQA
jgi:acyl-coenzyme A synthetase/AMP-(fatty) acid ligase